MSDTARVAVLALFTISFAFATIDIEGCTCMIRKLGSPCLVSEVPTAIFSGTVVKVVPGSDMPPSRPTVATVQTEKWYKGTGEDVVEVATGSSSGFCGYPFAEGQRLLLFANGSGKGFSTDICMATRSLDAADYLLDYLARSDLAEITRLDGYWADGLITPIRGTVMVKGPKDTELETDVHGLFAVNGLPPGEYAVSFQPHDPAYGKPPEQKVTLAAGQCSAFLVRGCTKSGGAKCEAPRVLTTSSVAK